MITRAARGHTRTVLLRLSRALGKEARMLEEEEPWRARGVREARKIVQLEIRKLDLKSRRATNKAARAKR